MFKILFFQCNFPSLLIVLPLNFLNFLVDFFNFEPILVKLSLEHIEFSSSGFHLPGFVFDLFLILTDNLGFLYPWLSLEYFPQLLYVLLLLLSDHLLLYYIFRLPYQSPLQCKYFSVHLITIWICPFQFPVPFFIQWVF